MLTLRLGRAGGSAGGAETGAELGAEPGYVNYTRLHYCLQQPGAAEAEAGGELHPPAVLGGLSVGVWVMSTPETDSATPFICWRLEMYSAAHSILHFLSADKLMFYSTSSASDGGGRRVVY